MERLGTFDEAKSKVYADVKRFLATIHNISALPCTAVENGIAVLDRLRTETYEDLNQIQHEYMIVCAAQWLLAEKQCPSETQWFWNPRQTGDNSEPDLRGVYQENIIIAAEITTSPKPAGTIDGRMQNTLSKLARMDGRKYYFVRTEAMYKRAETKVKKGGWEIQIIQLPLPQNALQQSGPAGSRPAALSAFG
jgi:hypothetical protein